MSRVLSINDGHCSSAEAWRPAIDPCESETDCSAVVDLAGMCPGDTTIQIEGCRLTICGGRGTSEIDDRRAGIHLMEIDHGRTVRTLDLPTEVDAERVTATYRSEYLRIRVPNMQR